MSYPLMLFAAGLGTRMGPLVKDKPKPLIEVGGRTLIDHALALAQAVDVPRKAVNVHYKGQMIRNHLAGRDIAFSDETDHLLETGGGLRHALPLLGSSPVITMNTDAVWHGPNPLRQLIDDWRDDMEALLLLVPADAAHGHRGKGDFDIGPNGKLNRGTHQIYTGLQLIRTDDLVDIPEPAFSLNLLWNKMQQRGGLYGTVWGGQWCDVGQPESIAIAERMLDV